MQNLTIQTSIYTLYIFYITVPTPTQVPSAYFTHLNMCMTTFLSVLGSFPYHMKIHLQGLETWVNIISMGLLLLFNVSFK